MMLESMAITATSATQPRITIGVSCTGTRWVCAINSTTVLKAAASNIPTPPISKACSNTTRASA